MARSQRGRDHKQHLIGKIVPWQSSPQEPDKPRWRVSALCGDAHDFLYTASPEVDYIERVHCDSGTYATFTRFDWSHNVCGACQSKFLAKKLKDEPIGYVLGERYDLSKTPIPHGISKYAWKSVYPVIDTGALAVEGDPSRIVAFVCIESGWGKSWEIHGWRSADSRRDENRAKPRLESDEVLPYTRRYEISGEKRETKSTANRLASKELALTLIPDMIADGHITKFYYQIVADDQRARNAYIEEERVREEERAASRARRDDELRKMTANKEHIEDAFRHMIGDEFLLNNFDREGIFMAAKLLGIDIIGEKVTPADPVAELDKTISLAEVAQRRVLERGIEQVKAVLADQDDGWKI